MHDAYIETFQVLAAFFSKTLLTLRGVIFPTVKHHGELQLEKLSLEKVPVSENSSLGKISFVQACSISPMRLPWTECQSFLTIGTDT